MEWKDWNGKKVFIRTKHGSVFNGVVKGVNTDDKPIIFISLIDKFGKPIMLVSSEIVHIKEEE